MENKSLASKTPRETLNEIKNGTFIKDFFKGTTKAAFFWNGLAWLIFIITFFIDWQITVGISCILSIMLMACAFDDMFEKEPNKHYWPPMSFLFWFVLFIFGIIGALYGLYKITIVPFNEWINDPYAKSWDKFHNFLHGDENKNKSLRIKFYTEYKDDSSSFGQRNFYMKNPRYWNKQLRLSKSN